MINRTRVVQLKSGQQRDEAINAHTIVVDGEYDLSETFHTAFCTHYEVIRTVVEGYDRPGVAMIAMDSEGPAGSACIAAKEDCANVAIIGRHGMADLFLDGDASLSLRHLVVILHPLGGSREARVRVVDLRTAKAFADERGQRMEALEAEGPIFIQVGRFLVFFLPTGEETPWPDDPIAGWECIPERVYLDNVPAEPDRWARHRLRKKRPMAALDSPEGPDQNDQDDDDEGEDLQAELEPVPTELHFELSHHEGRPTADDVPLPAQESQTDKPRPHRTIVQAISGPSRARRSLLDDNELPIGALRLRSGDGQCTVIIGQRAAGEGVLFGRYERCDNDGLTVLSNGRISRVHLLLVSIADTVYAIDAASTNGVWTGGKERRVTKLRFGTTLMLGDHLAHLEWLRAR